MQSPHGALRVEVIKLGRTRWFRVVYEYENAKLERFGRQWDQRAQMHRELVAGRWTYPATGHGQRGLR